MKQICRKSTVWVSSEWINHNMRNNRICYVSCLQGEAMFFPNYGFSLGLQPHPTLSRGVVVLWFRLPTQSFRHTALVFSNNFKQFLWYSKASRYTASSRCTFLNWVYKKIWGQRIYVAKTLSRGVIVLWFRLPTQSFRRTVLVFTKVLTNFYEIMWLHSNEPTLQMFTDKLQAIPWFTLFMWGHKKNCQKWKPRNQGYLAVLKGRKIG